MRHILLKLVLSISIFQVYAENSLNSQYISGTNQAPVAESESLQQINNSLESQTLRESKLQLQNTNNILDTYIRCYYLDKNSNKASVNYVWGKTDNNQYAIIRGNWYEKTRLWNNIYYTKASDIGLKQTCRNALQFAGFAEKDFNDIFVNYSAAMWTTSYDSDFWSDIKLPATNRFSRIVVLGDSAFDTHNMFDKMYWIFPNQQGYFHGRFSNGPVMVEYLSKMMSLPIKVIAEGGAEIKGAGAQGVVAKSLLEQFQLYQGFIDYLPSEYTNDIGLTLFIVFIGGNDFNQQTDADPSNKVPNLINNYLSVINKLINKGAKHIMVPVFPDITLFPDIAAKIKADPSFKTKIDQQISNFNAGIQSGIEHFNQDSKYKNVHIYRPNFDDMVLNARLSGAFKNLTGKCSNAGYINTPNRSNVCAKPLDYFMWDGMHPSTKAHCMWANALLEFLEIEIGVHIDKIPSCEYNYVQVN